MYYKVTCKCAGEYVSTSHRHNRFFATYTPGEWTYSKLGLLFVFSDHLHAVGFRDVYILGNSQIWECEIMGANPLPEMAVVAFRAATYWVEGGYTNITPKGTIGAYGVKLTRLVQHVL